MFKPLRHNRFVSFRVLSEDLLLPLWNLTTYFLDPKDMLQKYVPDMKVNIENLNQGSPNEESNDEKDIKEQDFEMLRKYIIRKKLVSRMLDKADSEQVKKIKLLDNPPLYNKIIDEDQAILIEIPILPASYVNIEDLDSEDLECKPPIQRKVG